MERWLRHLEKPDVTQKTKPRVPKDLCPGMTWSPQILASLERTWSGSDTRKMSKKPGW